MEKIKKIVGEKEIVIVSDRHKSRGVKDVFGDARHALQAYEGKLYSRDAEFKQRANENQWLNEERGATIA